jgi:RNA polymerase sigma factor (sigma-70 family)
VNPITSIAGHRQVSARLPRRLLARRSDEQLMELVHSGDDAAFEALYERHATGVLSFCRHMLGSQADAEEVLERAFVSIHLGILQASGGEVSFKPWVYTIARNHCTSVLRARRPSLSKQPRTPARPSTAGLRREVEQRDDLREILADIERLPEHQREAFVLTELRDLSLEQVAEVLSQDPATVKGLVFRARSTMIERSAARRAECIDVRESLQTAGDAEIARGPLRFHLDVCPDCSGYLGSLRHQRGLLGLALPVLPALALRKSVMASVGAGGTSAGVGAGAGAGAGVGVGMGSGAGAGGVAGGTVVGAAATSGASLAGSGVLAKVAIVGVLAGGTGVAADAVHETRARAAVEPAPAAVHQREGAHAPGDLSGLTTPVPGSVLDPPGGGVDGLAAPSAPIALHVPATADIPLAASPGGELAPSEVGGAPTAVAPLPLPPLAEVEPPIDVPAPVEALAPVEAPLVEVPAVEVPAVVEVPTVEVPSVELPPVEVAPVELPPVELPPVEVAPVELPPVELPPVELPPVELPPVELPPEEAPHVEPPSPSGPALGEADG